MRVRMLVQREIQGGVEEEQWDIMPSMQLPSPRSEIGLSIIARISSYCFLLLLLALLCVTIRFRFSY